MILIYSYIRIEIKNHNGIKRNQDNCVADFLIILCLRSVFKKKN